MWTHVATRSISCVKYQSFPWKILFPHNEMWHFHVTRRGFSTRRDMAFPRNVVNQMASGTITTMYLVNVATCNWNLWASAQAVYIPFRHAYYAFLLKFF